MSKTAIDMLRYSGKGSLDDWHMDKEDNTLFVFNRNLDYVLIEIFTEEHVYEYYHSNNVSYDLPELWEMDTVEEMYEYIMSIIPWTMEECNRRDLDTYVNGVYTK